MRNIQEEIVVGVVPLLLPPPLPQTTLGTMFRRGLFFTNKPLLKWKVYFLFGLGTNLDSFEANSILELDHPACILVLQIMSFSFEVFYRLFWSEPIDFPSKMVPCKFGLDLPLFGLQPLSKVHGSNLWLLTNRIALFHWTLNLGPSSKLTLKLDWNKSQVHKC